LADETSADFDAQCRLLSKLGLRYLDFRGAWMVNAFDLAAEQLCTAKTILASHGLRVSNISSPIGKNSIDEDFGRSLELMRHAADIARFFEAPYIRISSFLIPQGADADGYRDEVLRRIRELTHIAEKARVVLLHENAKDSYGATPRRCLDIVESMGSPNLRLAWDAGDRAPVGASPFRESYAALRPHLESIQIKYTLPETGQVAPFARRDGELVETLRSLGRYGYDGFISLEPRRHKASALDRSPSVLTEAWRAFTEILDAEDIPCS
jgi:sugar phosphate isomerase/epimerase